MWNDSDSVLVQCKLKSALGDFSTELGEVDVTKEISLKFPFL